MTKNAENERWHCPDCKAWVRADVDAHYCNAPVVITIPQPYPVYYPPHQVYPPIQRTWPYGYEITCGVSTLAPSDGSYTVNGTASTVPAA